MWLMCLVATLLICNVLLYLLLLYSFYFGVWAPAFYSVRYVLFIFSFSICFFFWFCLFCLLLNVTFAEYSLLLLYLT